MGVVLDVGLKAPVAREKSVAVLCKDENRRRFQPVASCALPHTEQSCQIACKLMISVSLQTQRGQETSWPDTTPL